MSQVWKRRAAVSSLLLGLVLVVTRAPVSSAPAGETDTLPSRLSDRAFWQLVEEISEPNGYFLSENLVGNERPLQHVVPALRAMKRGGVYLGVAPDQNFTYLIALEPKMAFIIDIRRGNLLQHLMYKAIIELSPTRPEFLSMLFSRSRPEQLEVDAPVGELFEAFWPIASQDELYEQNLRAIERHLTRTRQFRLSQEDLDQIALIYRVFFRYGPALAYSTTIGVGPRNMPSYAEMLQGTDLEGRTRSYLASEENYRWLRSFQEKNLLVPVVGDFAGPKALRSVGKYLSRHNAVVSAFYTSNVEQYLFRNAVARSFYDNVATLPLDASSIFIRSAYGRSVIDPILPLLMDVEAGAVRGYVDLTARGAVR